MKTISILPLAKLLAYVASALILVSCSGGSSDSAPSAVAPGGGIAAPDDPPQNPDVPATPATINALENAKPGSSAWQLVNPALNHEIEGYASLTSVNRGEEIDFFVNTAAASYNVDIYRMGYYGGAGARLMQSFAGIARQEQTLPCLNPDNVIECNWNLSLRLRIPASAADPAATDYWASGIYLAKLSTNATPVRDSYIIFVVRDDARQAAYVQQLPVTTYQAYNFWGGKSLYTGCETHPDGWDCGAGAPPATAVSFNRPYGRGVNAGSAAGLGAGEFLTNVQPARAAYQISNAGWDYNMLRWVEKQGYDTKYISSLDLHENSTVLQGARAFVSTGHDEYYSKAMWDRLVAARSTGINLAFFAANQVYWQVRFAEGAYGSTRRNRIMICYRGGGDPVSDNNLATNQFRYLGRSEAQLLGNQYVADPVVGDVTIANAAHWLYAQTGATEGAKLPGLLGYEVNAYVEGVSPAQTRILARSPFTFEGRNLTSDVTYYVDRSSAQVFSSGTIQWSWGLDSYIPGGLRPDYASPVAQAFTANLYAAIGERNLYGLTQADAGLELAISPGEVGPTGVVTSPTAPGNGRAGQWRLAPAGEGGWQQVVARGNGLCLQAFGAGAAVATRECNGADQQRWRIDASSAETVTLTEKSSGLCLQAGGAGAASVTASCSGSAGQRWLRVAIP